MLHEACLAVGRDTFRLYNCRRCEAQVRLCGGCDRGNIYCVPCAPLGRTHARRRASARYQKTRRGALRHAARQRAYRARRTQKVTDNGCARVVAAGTVPALVSSAPSVSRDTDQTPNPPRRVVCGLLPARVERFELRCAVCRCVLPAFARLHTRHGVGWS